MGKKIKLIEFVLICVSNLCFNFFEYNPTMARKCLTIKIIREMVGIVIDVRTIEEMEALRDNARHPEG